MRVPSNDISVHVHAKKHGKAYPYDVLFEQRAFSPNARSWLWPALESLAAAGRNGPLNRQTVDNLHKGLATAESLPNWQALTSKRPGAATLDDVIAFFSELEQTLREAYPHAPRHAGRISADTRRFIRRYLRTCGADPRLERLPSLYRTQLPVKTRSRELISDILQPGKSPVGALPHASIAELKEKTTRLLEDDLARIRNACSQELARYQSAVSAIKTLRSVPFDEAKLSWLRSELEGPYTKRRELLEGPHSSEAIALMLQVAARLAPPLKPVDSNTRHAGSWAAVAKLKPIVDFGQNILQIANLEIAPPVITLTAAAVLLMSRTGWNFDSILALSASDIHSEPLACSLQSTKGKTGDATPIVILGRNDEDILRAVDFLLERLKLMQERGWVGEADTRLWLSSRTILSGKPDQVANWRSGLDSLIARYGLPRFSFEQIRNQAISITVLGTGDLADGQLAAGHAQLTTTHRYVQGILLQRRNSAILLEFERRFDATVRYMIDPSSVPSEQKLVAYPIGDGASCRKPDQPPDTTWLRHGLCAGRNCHDGGGCTNRLLLIDEARIKEVLHTRRFYLSQWRRMHAENPAAFEAHHLNAMLFNFALYGYMQRGPYRHLLTDYEHQEHR